MQRLPAPSPRLIAAIYALFATIALLLTAPAMPPFQNTDEFAHALRADAVSHGEAISRRLPDGQVGGRIDHGLAAASAQFDPIRFHRERKVTRPMYAPVPWLPLVPAGFPNTAVYPPFFYIPAALALFAARHLHLSVLHGLLAARLATGAITIAGSTAAIALAEGAAPWLFAILLLPMSIALTAALSQDGPMLAATALAVSLCLRLRAAPAPPARGLIILVCALLALAGMARPPYAAFACLALALPVRPAWRWTGFAAILLATALWAAINAHLVVLPQFPGRPVDPYTQLLHLLRHPARLWPLLANTWATYHHFWKLGFIGMPGWLDVDLPPQYHAAAWAMLALAAAATLAGTRGRPRPAMLGAVAVAVLGAVAGMAAIQYLTWTPLDAAVIDGLQGRYCLAPALLLGAALARPALRPSPLTWPVLIFPVLSIPVLMHALVVRYYLAP